MRVKLKPCPCCGRENPFEYIQDSSLVIYCHGCALEMKRALVPPAEWEKAAVACREAWNKRPEAADEILNLRFTIAKAYARLDDGGDRRVIMKDLAKTLGENEDVY